MLSVIGGVDALARGDDPCRWWYAPPPEVASQGPALGSSVRRDVFRPPVPSLSIPDRAQFFCLGSCFARRIEDALVGLGRNVLSLPADIARMRASMTERGLDHYLNYYNSLAMATALDVALDRTTPPDDAVVTLSQGGVIDVLGQPSWVHASPKLALHWRRMRHESLRSLTRADVVVITLGLAEGWRDNRTGLFLNDRPEPCAVRDDPARFDFCVTDFGDNLQALRRVVRTVHTVCDPGTAIVLTVSPVPLRATYGERDVVTASTYGKAVLRAVAETVAGVDDELHYFPSFEMAHHSRQDLTWADDQAHVSTVFTEAVVEHFFSSIAPDQPVD